MGKAKTKTIKNGGIASAFGEGPGVDDAENITEAQDGGNHVAVKISKPMRQRGE